METSCAQNKNVADAFIILLELINIDKIFNNRKKMEEIVLLLLYQMRMQM